MQNETNQKSLNEVAAAQPRRALSWYDHVWAALPIVLLFTGGTFGVVGNLLGGLVGAAGAYLNMHILRGKRGAVLRYFLSFLATIGMFVVFAILITIYQAYTQKL